MKSSEIIDHILNLPPYFRLKSLNQTTGVLKSLLGKAKSAQIDYAFERENSGICTLFIVVSHPLALQELKHDSSIFLIKSLLKKYLSLNPGSSLKIPDKIEFIVRKNRLNSVAEFSPAKQTEKSRGEFVNLARDERIHSAFERLREIIKNASR